MPSPIDHPPTDAAGSTDTEPWGWTRQHTLGIALILTATLVFLAINYARNPWRLDDPLVIVNGQPVALDQQLDPNSAPWPSLARLPHVGETLARRLVAYRQENAAADGIVFHNLDDLEKIGGFGPKTREGLREYLKFPAKPRNPLTP